MRIAAPLLLFALFASPAAGLDLTGTWTGKFTCTEWDGSQSRFTEKDDVMAITQTGDLIAVDSLNQFSGAVLSDLRKPLAKGVVKMANCNTDNDPANGADELAVLKAKVNRDKGTGKLKGASVYTGVGSFGTCKWSYKLTDPADPGATGCN